MHDAGWAAVRDSPIATTPLAVAGGGIGVSPLTSTGGTVADSGRSAATLLRRPLPHRTPSPIATGAADLSIGGSGLAIGPTPMRSTTPVDTTADLRGPVPRQRHSRGAPQQRGTGAVSLGLALQGRSASGNSPSTHLDMAVTGLSGAGAGGGGEADTSPLAGVRRPGASPAAVALPSPASATSSPRVTLAPLLHSRSLQESKRDKAAQQRRSAPYRGRRFPPSHLTMPSPSDGTDGLRGASAPGLSGVSGVSGVRLAARRESEDEGPQGMPPPLQRSGRGRSASSSTPSASQVQGDEVMAEGVEGLFVGSAPSLNTIHSASSPPGQGLPNRQSLRQRRLAGGLQPSGMDLAALRIGGEEEKEGGNDHQDARAITPSPVHATEAIERRLNKFKKKSKRAQQNAEAARQWAEKRKKQLEEAQIIKDERRLASARAPRGTV